MKSPRAMAAVLVQRAVGGTLERVEGVAGIAAGMALELRKEARK